MIISETYKTMRTVTTFLDISFYSKPIHLIRWDQF